MATCHLCPAGEQSVPDPDLMDHLQLMHPDAYDDVGRWPDGTPVIVDLTLEPDDFETEQPR